MQELENKIEELTKQVTTLIEFVNNSQKEWAETISNVRTKEALLNALAQQARRKIDELNKSE